MIAQNDFKELEKTSLKVREHIIRMATDGGCFIGASLSCADLLVYLYFNYLNINKENLNNPERDYLFLSKGHDVPALYGALAEKGIFDTSRLNNHLKTSDNIYWHPNTKIPGIEFYSGSLGHLISVASGVAYDCKIKNTGNKVIVILGDGEMNEGSVWEALLVASAKKLDNLIIVIDRNQFQANMRTEELTPLEPLDRKLEAFGCQVYICNGHNYTDLNEVFMNIENRNDLVTAVIADTIRGKGLPSIEARADRWFCNFTKEEVDALISELHTQTKAEIYSETLIVR